MYALLPRRKAQTQPIALALEGFPLFQKGTIMRIKLWEEIAFWELLTHQATLMLVCILPILAALGLLTLGSGWVSFSYHAHLGIQVLNDTGKFTTNPLPALALNL